MKMPRRYLAAIVLVAVFASGVGAGQGIKLFSSAKEGLNLKGNLQVTALRPLVKGGCDKRDVANAATLNYLKDQTRSVLERILQPSIAVADDTLACQAIAVRTAHNLIVNSGETALRDCFNNNASTECDDVIKTLKFHGLGTGTTAAAEGNTGLETELTTQYNPDNTRATGSQTTNGANVYRTIGTNTIDSGTPAVTEWGLFNAASSGVLWSRVVFSAINLAANDSLQTTYDLTIE